VDTNEIAWRQLSQHNVAKHSYSMMRSMMSLGIYIMVEVQLWVFGSVSMRSVLNVADLGSS